MAAPGAKIESAATEPRVPKHYKQTEVGIIPEDWEAVDYVAFGQIIDGDRGIHYPGSGDLRDSGHCLFLNAGNVTKRGFRFSECQFISAEKDRKLNKGKLTRGDLILTTRGTLGNIAWFNDTVPFEHIRINSGMVILRNTSPIVSNAYLYHVLLSRIGESQIERLSFGSAQPQLTVKGISTLKIPLPPNEAEQEAIADALSDADALIESLEQLLAKKRYIRQGAMQKLLSGRRRRPGFGGEWQIHALGEDITLLSGHHVLAQYCNSQSSGVPYLTGPADFPSGTIRHTKFTERPTTLCAPNDILVTVKGSGCGSLVVADGVYCISRQLMAIRVRDWDYRFIYYSLLKRASKIAEASTGLIPGLSRSDILEQKLWLPPTITEQKDIAAVLSDMDAEITALETKLGKARNIKQGMMQELLTGRVRLV